jgi:hypothetical protein
MLRSWRNFRKPPPFPTVLCPFRSGLGIAQPSYRNAGTMPEKDFYLLIILSVVISLLLIQIVVSSIGRRRKGRRFEREIAEHLRKKAAGQFN